MTINMHLFIHTLLGDQLVAGLFNKRGMIDKICYQSPAGHSRMLLDILDKLFKRNNIKLNNLKGLVVINGPGSFTSIRIGLAAANTLAYLLKIPAVGAKLDEFKTVDDLIRIGRQKLSKTKKWQLVSPFYGKEPNITRAESVPYVKNK